MLYVWRKKQNERILFFIDAHGDADAETLMRTAAENGFDGIELWAQHAETKKLDWNDPQAERTGPEHRSPRKELGSELRGIKRCGPEGIR